MRLAIQEALSMMVGAYVNLQGALLNLMEALVAAYITKVCYYCKLPYYKHLINKNVNIKYEIIHLHFDTTS